MANFEDIAKKAFYMGVGFASYAQEKASDTVKDLGVQAQKLAEEMAARGEMSTEEARKFVDDLVEQAQQGTVAGKSSPAKDREPRRIEIVDETVEDVESKPTATASKTEKSAPADGDDLRKQVQSLQEELRRLRQEM
jgi:polyhydroxyalkanoate synthesis regulator phasin